MNLATRRFVTSAEAFRGQVPWAVEEWLCRSDVVQNEHLLMVRVSMKPGRAHGASGIVFSEQRLPLQVTFFNEIPIYDAQPAHSGPAQCLCLDSAQSTAAQNDDQALRQALLPIDANFTKEYLAGIPGRNHSTFSQKQATEARRLREQCS